MIYICIGNLLKISLPRDILFKSNEILSSILVKILQIGSSGLNTETIKVNGKIIILTRGTNNKL